MKKDSHRHGHVSKAPADLDKKRRRKYISDAVKAAFQSGCPAALEAQVQKQFPSVLGKTTGRLMERFGMDYATAKAIANKGVVYALAGRINGKIDGEFTQSDWEALAISQSNNLAKSSFRGTKEELTIDAPRDRGTDESDVRGESHDIGGSSYENWRNQEIDSARAETASTVYSRRDYLYRKCGISKLAGEIFSAYCLENRSTEEVARQFHMKYEAVQTSACRTRQRLAEFGPEVVRELLAEAA